MGLPMFREPDEAVAEEVAVKLDRAAATQRSAIRRQPTVRHSRYNTSAARERIRERYRNDEDRNTELQIAQMEAEIARLRSRRQREDTPSSRSVAEAALRDSDELLHHSRTTFRDDEENHDSAPAPVRRYARLPRPDRQSSLRFEVGAQRSGSVSPRRLRLLSPPSSSGSGRNIPDGPVDVDYELERLTPGFAPAHYHDGDSRGLETPPPETWDSLPPLVRASRRPDRPPPRWIDGLGDRRRSLSPDANTEEANWSNLLNNIGNRSSTATSFASNGDSTSRSRASQTTVATSFGEIGADDSCDLDLPVGITEDIARNIREQHRSRERQQRRNGEPDGPIMTGAQGLRMHEAQLRRSRQGRMHDGDLRMIQMLIEQQSRGRDDVPDDWWAVMGLDEDGRARTASPARDSDRLRQAEDVMQELSQQREAERAVDSEETRSAEH